MKKVTDLKVNEGILCKTEEDKPIYTKQFFVKEMSCIH